MGVTNQILELILRAKDEATARVKGLFGSFTELSSALGLAKQGFQAVNKVIEETVGKTVEHTRSNYELSLTMGTTVEEASRLAEVADDNRISIEQLGSAMALARKNGFEPSIENLAQLADELKGINSNTEKATKLNEIFGRGWKVLLPMLEGGGDSIRDQAAAINENLIVTGDMVKQEEAYRLALDNANDALDAQVYVLGNQLLPLLTQVLIPAHTEVINGQAYLVKQIGDTTQAWIRHGNILEDVSGEYALLKGMSSEVRMEAQKGYDTKPLKELGGAADEAAGKIGLVTANLSEISQQTLASEAVAALNKAYSEGKIDEAEYRTLLAEIGQKLSGLPAEQVIASMALFDLKQSLDDGSLSASDFIDELEHLNDWMNNIDRDIDINIRYHITTSGSPPAGGGGPPGTGQTPEFFPSLPGPGPQKTIGAGGNAIAIYGDIIINSQPWMEPGDVYAIALRAFADAVNKSGGSKSSVFVE